MRCETRDERMTHNAYFTVLLIIACGQLGIVLGIVGSIAVKFGQRVCAERNDNYP